METEFKPQLVSNENNLSKISKERLEEALERELLVRQLNSNVTINSIKKHTVNENFQCFKKVRSLVEGNKHFSNPKSQLNFLIDSLSRHESNILAEHLYAAVAIEWEVLVMGLCHYLKDISKLVKITANSEKMHKLSCLHKAVRLGNADLFKMLLKFGADPSVLVERINASDNWSLSCLGLAIKLETDQRASNPQQAIKYGRIVQIFRIANF